MFPFPPCSYVSVSPVFLCSPFPRVLMFPFPPCFYVPVSPMFLCSHFPLRSYVPGSRFTRVIMFPLPCVLMFPFPRVLMFPFPPCSYVPAPPVFLCSHFPRVLMFCFLNTLCYNSCRGQLYKYCIYLKLIFFYSYNNTVCLK